MKKGDRLLSIPTTLHMTPSAVAASPVGAAVAEVTADFSREWRLVQKVIREGTVRLYWLRSEVFER